MPTRLVLTPSAAPCHRAVDIQDRWRFGFWDSPIVAGVLSGGRSVLLSEDCRTASASSR